MSRLPRERRQEELVREALRAFGARGYDGTTLEAVAEAAGVRKQTLLYYFPTKEDLFDACVDALVTGLEQSLSRVLGGPDGGLDRVESVIRTLFRLAEHWPEFPLFLREAARRSPAVVQRVADALEPFRKSALGFLERGMEAGAPPAGTGAGDLRPPRPGAVAEGRRPRSAVGFSSARGLPTEVRRKSVVMTTEILLTLL
jgi:AcrR family transcriptional regulator